MKKILLTILALTFFISLSSQNKYHFGFERDNTVIVQDSLGNNLINAWTGGLNASQTQTIDINLDGKADLISFDLHGDKLKTFVNTGSVGNPEFTYAPEYESRFPPIQYWVKLRDYNGDGKKDIFVSNNGGIRVYKNISNPVDGLKFSLSSNGLLYNNGGIYINVYASTVDYAGIADVDNDGDMDVVSFGVLGGRVYYYKNLSLEIHNDIEAWEFKVDDYCWGKFYENDSTNVVYLNQPCTKDEHITNPIPKNNIKHMGSTITLLDMDNDNVKDMILGDVDYFNLNLLYNGGSIDSAHFTSQEPDFPVNSTAVNLVDFPLSNYVDVDNDSVNDLLISNFDYSNYNAETRSSLWYYKNTGGNSNPNFNLIEKRFLQNTMIDVGDESKPAIVDVNNDGLMDIVIGNNGKIDSAYLDSTTLILSSIKFSQLTYYENTGTQTNPKFKLMDNNWQNIMQYEYRLVRPTFADLDGDGDVDMLLGSEDGDLKYFENTAGSGNPINFAAPVENYQNISVGTYSSPQLIDISGDSLVDLVIGKKNGSLSYYQNTGTANNPSFNLITNSMGNVDVSTYYHSSSSYSNPYFYKDENDSLKLFVGSASGITFFYKDIKANIQSDFGIDTNIMYIQELNGFIIDTLYSVLQFKNSGNVQEFMDVGLKSSPAVYDFDNDGKMDMILGSVHGGLNYFKGTEWPFVGIKEADNVDIESNIYPNPNDGSFTLEIVNYAEIKKLNYRIFDISGKMIEAGNKNPSQLIDFDVNNKTNGLYFIELNFENKYGDIRTKVEKIVVR